MALPRFVALSASIGALTAPTMASEPRQSPIPTIQSAAQNELATFEKQYGELLDQCNAGLGPVPQCSVALFTLTMFAALASEEDAHRYASNLVRFYIRSKASFKAEAFSYAVILSVMHDQNRRKSIPVIENRLRILLDGDLTDNKKLRAERYTLLAVDLHTIGMAKASEPYFRKALTLRLTEGLSSATEMAWAYVWLSTSVSSQQRYAEAVGLQKQAIACLQQVNSTNQQLLGYVHYKLADTLMKQGDLSAASEAAIESYKLLADQKKGFSPLNSYELLGHIQILRGRYASAEKIFRYAIAKREGGDDNDQQILLRNYTYLATAIGLQGNYAEAERWSKQAVKLGTSLGTKPSVASALRDADLAEVLLRQQKELPLARTMYRSAGAYLIKLLNRRPGPAAGDSLELELTQAGVKKHAYIFRGQIKVAWMLAHDR